MATDRPDPETFVRRHQQALWRYARGLGADVIRLLRALPKLRTLSLNGCYRATPAVLDAIRAAPSLSHLDATALAWMTPELARELEKAKPGLSVTR